MYRILFTCLSFMFVCFTTPLPALEVDLSAHTIEESFSLNQMRIVTFNMKQTVNLTLKYHIENGEKTPSSIIQDSAILFLNNYEGKRDFWETINKNLIMHLSKEFHLSFIQSEIQVLPGRTFPYLRSSIIQLENGKVSEVYLFKYKNQEVIQNYFPGAILDISYTYVDEVSPIDYLDFVDLKKEVDKFLISTQIDPHSWPDKRQLLIDCLLEKFTMLSAIEILMLN